MITINDTELLENKIREGLDTDNQEGLRALLALQHPADIADIIDRLDEDDQLRVFRLLTHEQAAEVLDETGLDATRELCANLPRRKRATSLTYSLLMMWRRCWGRMCPTGNSRCSPRCSRKMPLMPGRYSTTHRTQQAGS